MASLSLETNAEETLPLHGCDMDHTKHNWTWIDLNEKFGLRGPSLILLHRDRQMQPKQTARLVTASTLATP